MSNSHLNSIQKLLNKKSEKSLSQGQVEKIESHFRAMSNIHDEHENRQDTVNKRQKAFDEFQQKVESEGTCVITLTPEELLTKGIEYKKSLTKQATEAVQAMYAWGQATAELSLNFYGILSDTWLDNYANTPDTTEKDQKQEAQAIEPHAPVDLLDAMEHGESGYQEQVDQPTHEEESVTTASEQEEDEFLSLSTSTEFFDSDDARSRSSTSSTISALTLASSGEPVSNKTENLTLAINDACNVLRTYLRDDDKARFEQLYQDMMDVIDNLSPKPGNAAINKIELMASITALQDELEPQKFNFEGHGGLDEEHVTLWFKVKFWLCSTFKAILNAVGLRSAANFFTPALSEREQNTINENVGNLKDAVDQFENTLKNTYPDPDSDADSESEPDSNISFS